LAKRTASGLNEIRKLINIETKFHRVAAGPTVSTTGQVAALSNIAQGLNYTDRVGDSIKLQSIEARFKCIMNTASNGTALRILILRDLYQQGVDPTLAQVLEQTGPLEPRNFLLRDRFSILVDELVYMSNAGDTGTVLEYHIPHEGHIKYIGTTAASASNGFGSLYLMMVSDEGTNIPTVSYNIDFYYTDD
jgi:hypothetical protein